MNLNYFFVISEQNSRHLYGVISLCELSISDCPKYFFFQFIVFQQFQSEGMDKRLLGVSKSSQ